MWWWVVVAQDRGTLIENIRANRAPLLWGLAIGAFLVLAIIGASFWPRNSHDRTRG